MKVVSASGILLLGFFTLALGDNPGRPKKEDVPKYLDMLVNSKSAKDRAVAAEMLGSRGEIKASDVAGAIEPLKNSLQKDSDFNVRRAAAEALGSIGADAPGIVPLLIDSLKEKNTLVKQGAIRALGRYGAEARDAVPSLRDIAKDKTDKMTSQLANLAIKSINGKKK
jgi:hypothetical protein